MAAQKVKLNNRDWQKINEVLNKDLFEGVENIVIEDSGPISGLGRILTLSFDYYIDGVQGTFSTEISGVENW